MTYKDYGPFLGTMVNRIYWHSFDDKPAIIYKNCEDNQRSGSKWWYINGKQHREDGPAVIFPDGSQLWYLNDVNITENVTNWASERNIDLNNMSDVDKMILKTEIKMWK
jgi:hypothetical protein